MPFSASKIRDILVPVVVSIGIFLAAMTIANYQNEIDKSKLEQSTRLAAANFAARLETQLGARLKAGELLAEHLEEARSGGAQSFRSEAAFTHALFDHLQALNWVDPDGTIRIVTPEDANLPAIGLDIKDLEFPALALKAARQTGKMHITPPIELAQGGRGFAAYVPIGDPADRLGFVNVVLRIEPFLSAVMAETDVQRYAVDITDDNSVVYKTRQRGNDLSLVSSSVVHVGQRRWRVSVAPTAQQIDAASSMLDEAILLLGFLAAALCGVSLRLLFVRQRMVRKSEARLRDIADNTDNIIWIMNADFTETLYINSAFERYFGLNREDIRRKALDWTTRLSLSDAERVRKSVSDALDQAKLGGIKDIYRIDFSCLSIQSAQGKTRQFLARLIAMQDKYGQIDRFVGIATDVTNLLSAQEALRETNNQLLHMQKQNAIGILTSGIAHDFNNLLAIIVGNTEILLQGNSTPKIAESLEDILAASNRAADLTKNMLAFAGQSQLAPMVLDLNDVVQEAREWMSRPLTESVSLELALSEGLWMVEIDRSGFESALLNLLLNASDAIGGVGKIRIKTENLFFDEMWSDSSNHIISPGRYVMIMVEDEGRGISEEQLTHIFDPFYTTKREAGGAGLGLSMVQGFIRQSGGAVRVKSKIGNGSRFELFIPASAKSKPRLEKPEAPIEERVTSARLLLVDDNDKVRAVMAKQLKASGYEVIEASSGLEGLELYRTHAGINLIISDIVMPGKLQGPQMAQSIREIDARARFLFVSGYASTSTSTNANLDASDRLLLKPVRRSDLVRCVEEMLSLG